MIANSARDQHTGPKSDKFGTDFVNQIRANPMSHRVDVDSLTRALNKRCGN